MGARCGLVAVALEQTQGRGRLGRSWISPKGKSLSLSVLLGCAEYSRHPQLLVKATSVSMAMALKNVFNITAQLKWPNDIEVHGRKIAGVLAEAKVSGNVAHVVVGIGVNLDLTSVDLNLVQNNATSVLQETGSPSVGRLFELVSDFLINLDGCLAELRLLSGESRLGARYLELCSTVGELVKVQVGSEIIYGVAQGIGSDGQLLVQSEGKMVEISAGDVTHLRTE